MEVRHKGSPPPSIGSGATTPEAAQLVEPLYQQGKAGHWDIVLGLLEQKSTLVPLVVSFKNPRSKWTFLHQAAYCGNQEAAEFLLSHGADIQAVGADLLTPIDVAKKKNHRTLRKWLEEQKKVSLLS